jgi:hypothetical protein
LKNLPPSVSYYGNRSLKLLLSPEGKRWLRRRLRKATTTSSNLLASNLLTELNALIVQEVALMKSKKVTVQKVGLDPGEGIVYSIKPK